MGLAEEGPQRKGDGSIIDVNQRDHQGKADQQSQKAGKVEELNWEDFP
jgi:hypothetical protein